VYVWEFAKVVVTGKYGGRGMSRRFPILIRAVRALSLTSSEREVSLAVLFKEDIKFALPEFPVVAVSDITVAAFALYIERSSKNVAMF
jgi:hypothetical protein